MIAGSAVAMLRAGSEVRWEWGSAVATGKIVEHFERTVSRTLKGTKVTKRGTRAAPAYLIEEDDGHRVLKLASERERA